MSLYSSKKQLFFSCVENLNLINSFIHDESVCTRKKSSEILEKRLFDSFLSKNDQIRFWILNLYQGGSSGDILPRFLNTIHQESNGNLKDFLYYHSLNMQSTNKNLL